MGSLAGTRAEASAPARVQRAPSLTEQAYRLLREEILARRLRPGARLVERVLAQRFGLSKTPVREAIARLERDGLVEVVPSQGAVVRRLGLQEVRNLLELRQVLEGFAARRAAERADEATLENLERILEQADRVRRLGRPELYREYDLQFHALIREAAGNETLTQVMEGLGAQIRLVMSTSAALPGRIEASVSEHRRILEALRRRQPAEAERAACEHIQRALEAVERHWAAIERGEV